MSDEENKFICKRCSRELSDNFTTHPIETRLMLQAHINLHENSMKIVDYFRNKDGSKMNVEDWY